jgi:putative transposase
MEEVKQGYPGLLHSKWECKYHVVFIPKRRRRAMFGQVRPHLGKIFHALAQQKECQILEGHLLPDHVHMGIAVAPKHPVASVIGFSKGRGPSLWLGSLAARSAISPGNSFGLGDTRYPPLVLN